MLFSNRKAKRQSDRRRKQKREHKHKHKRERSTNLEKLEVRDLLASDFTNPTFPLDVSNDGFLTPVDAFIVIADLNEVGGRELGNRTGDEPFIDTNGDGFVSPIDALVVINQLNVDDDGPDIQFSLVFDSAAEGTNNDGVTNNPTVGGRLFDPAGIRRASISVDGGPNVDLEVTSDGRFTFDPQFALDGSADGNHIFQVTAEDTLGNVSAPAALEIELDTLGPAANVGLAQASDTGVVGDGITTADSIVLVGTTEPNGLVRLFSETASVQADASGQFEIQDIALGPGRNQIRLLATDLAGNMKELEESVFRAESDDTFGLVESSPMSSEQVVPVDLGTQAEPKQLRIRFETQFDLASPAGLINDVFHVFLIDSSNTSQTILPASRPGQPVFSLDENGATPVPSIATIQGNELVIDASQVAGQSGSLKLQLLSGDQDQDSVIVIESITSELRIKPSSSIATNTLGPILPSGPVDLGELSETNDLTIEFSQPKFESTTGLFSATGQITNLGNPTGRDTAIVLRNLPDGVTLPDAESDQNGNPVLNLREAIPFGGLLKGQSSRPFAVNIQNSQNTRFELDVEILQGPNNRPPTMEALAPLSSTPGDIQRVQVVSSDPDGDPVTLRLLSESNQGPLNIRFEADGRLVLQSAPGQIGQFRFAVEASDGAATSKQTLEIEVVADSIKTTRLTGQVLDTNREPIPGITANIGSTSTLTDAEGRFTLEEPVGGFDSATLDIHGEEFVGADVFPFIAERLPLLFEGLRDPFPGVNNILPRPIYLPALDVAGGTTIDPASDTEVEQEIAPGEMAKVAVAAGTLKDQQGDDFDSVLSITEVPRELTPAALPPDLLPGTVVTIQPGEMVFEQPAPLDLPNRGGFAANSELDLFSINPVTGEFDIVGLGRVSRNGQLIETVEGGIRNSSWHFFARQFLPIPNVARSNVTKDPRQEPANQDDNCARCEALAESLTNGDSGDSQTASSSIPAPDQAAGFRPTAQRERPKTFSFATSDVELHSGALSEHHDLVTYQSLGAERGLSLHYNSQRADLRPIAHFTVDNADGDFLVASADVRRNGTAVRVPGAPSGQFGLQGGEHFWRVPNGQPDITAGMLVDLSDQPSGIYNIDLRFGVHQFNDGQFIGTSRLSTIEVTLVNAVNSEFGAGWNLAGLQEVIPTEAGGVILIDADSTELFFDPPEELGAPFVSPAGDFSTMEQLPDGTFRRTLTDQTVIQFNADNRIVSITDRNANQTTFNYDADGILESVVDPVGLTTQFVRTGNRVTEIVDPAQRSTLLEYDEAGNLIRIADPDGTSRQFSYDEKHHLTGETDKRGFSEEAVYGFHGRVIQANRKDGTTTFFNALQTFGVFPAELTSDVQTAPNVQIVGTEGAAQASDPNGNVIDTQLDQAGQVSSQSDVEGNLPAKVRDQDNLTVIATDGRGNANVFDYDDRGNVTSFVQTAFDRPIKLFANHHIELGGTGSSVALADLDGDGDLDAVASMASLGFSRTNPTPASHVMILENVGGGVLEEKQRLLMGGRRPDFVSLKDLNGDTLPDIAVTDDDGFAWRFGNGDLSFQPRQSIALGDDPVGFDSGDLDGDGHAEIVIASFRSSDATLLRSDAQGSFTVEQLPLGRRSRDATVGDFNQDGLLDVGFSTFGTVEIFDGLGGGALDAPRVISNVGAEYFSLETGDVNRDGADDLVATSNGLFHVALSQPDGSFPFADFTSGLASGTGVIDIDIADMNRDGFAEIILSPDSQNVRIFENLGFGEFSEDARRGFNGGERESGTAVGDIDGDGDQDFLVANLGSLDGGVTLIEGLPNGAIKQQSVRPLAGSTTTTSELSDMTGDGIPDLVSIVSFATGVRDTFVSIREGDGLGGFSDEAVLGLLDMQEAHDLTIDDFNGDGLPDVAAVAGRDTSVAILFMQEDGTFSDVEKFPFEGSGESIESADLNRDGLPDIVARYASFTQPSRIITMVNDGDGGFTSTEIAADFARDRDDAIQISDVNTDGFLDIIGVTPNRFFAQDRPIVLFGDGTGGFTGPQEFPVALDLQSAAPAADVNGDGINDIMVLGKGLAVHLGLPEGGFAPPETITFFNNDFIATGANVVDIDLDGDLDLLTMLSQEAVLLFLENDGQGAFSINSSYTLGGRQQSIATADVDLDGDLDVAVTNGNDVGVNILLNSTIHECGAGLCSERTEYDDTFNQVTRFQDRLGRVSNFEVDPANGNLLERTLVFGQPDGQSAENDDIVERFTYNAQGQLETFEDPLGRITLHEYDAQGRIVATTEAVGTPDEATMRFEYDAAGNISAEVDENGHRTEMEYDALDRVVVIRDTLSGETRLTYDANGNVIRVLDELGQETRFEYDALDRMIREIDALGNATTFEYDGNGNQVRVTDRLGRSTEFRYDARNRLIETIDAEGGRTQKFYDADDNLVRSVDENGNEYRSIYNQRRLRTTLVDPLGGHLSVNFDAASNVTQLRDELSRVTDFVYDEADRQVEIRFPSPDAAGPLGRPIQQNAYDKSDNLIEVTDPLGNITSFQFDSRDRMVERQSPDPDGNGPLARPITTFEYDNRFLLTAVTDPLGDTVRFEYDALDRLVREVQPDPDGAGPLESPVLKSTYDAASNLESVTDALGNTVVYEYDSLNRVVKTIEPDPDSAGPLTSPVTTFTYDAEGQRISTVDPLTRETRHEYDRLGRVVKVIDPDPDREGPDSSPVTTFTYDASGNQTSITDPLGNVTQQVFDPLDRLVRLVDADPDRDGPLASPVTNFFFDAAGQLLRVVDPLGREFKREFDDLGRVVRVIEEDPDGSGPDSAPVTEFEFDLVGNLLQITDPLGNATQFEYDGLHREVLMREADPDGDGPLDSPVHRMAYDAENKLIESIDPLGRVTHFVYDSLDRMIRTTSPDPDNGGPLTSPERSMSYDAMGNVVSTTDALGNVTQYEYDNLLRLIRTIEPDPDESGPQGQVVTTTAYDAVDMIVSSTDALGRQTLYEYDDLARVTRIVNPDPDGPGPMESPVVIQAYDLFGNMTSVTDSNGNVTELQYDGLHRLVRQIDPDPDGTGPKFAPVTKLRYDAADQLIALVDPLNRVTTYEYDGLGRDSRMTEPDPDGDGPGQSPTTTATYDLVGNLLRTEDALGNRTEFEYDNLFRRVSVRDGNGDVTRYSFDAVGNQLEYIDPILNTTSYEYDGLNRVVVETNALGDSRSYAYDAEDNMVSMTDRNGRVIEKDYDRLHRRVRERWLEQGNQVNVLEFEFDEANQLLRSVDQGATHSYQYDGLGRITSNTQVIAGLSPNVRFTYAYDAVGNVLRNAAVVGNVADYVNKYSYDGLNRPVQITQGGSPGGNAVASKRIDFAYDVASQFEKLSRFEDLAASRLVADSSYQFDGTGRLVELEHAQNQTPLAGYTWSFDAGQRIVQMTSLLDGVSDFAYDSRNQLLSADHDFQDDESFAYDKNGNRTSGGSVVGTNNLLQSDGVFRYDYDDEGNRTKRIHIASGQVTEYFWDHRNRLVRVVERATDGGAATLEVQHQYDAFNLWVGTTVDLDGDGQGPATQRFYVHDGSQVVLEFGGSNAEDLEYRYLWGNAVDQLLAQEEVDSLAIPGAILWPFTDHLGSVRDLASFDPNTGVTSIANHRVYDSFGNLTSETNAAVDSLFGFTGRAFDEATGLQNNHNRWYDSSTGGWLSEDPLSFEAGDANLNRYVNNNPLSATDPDGLLLSFIGRMYDRAAGFVEGAASFVVDTVVDTVVGSINFFSSVAEKAFVSVFAMFEDDPAIAAEIRKQGLGRAVADAFNTITDPAILGKLQQAIKDLIKNRTDAYNTLNGAGCERQAARIIGRLTAEVMALVASGGAAAGTKTGKKVIGFVKKGSQQVKKKAGDVVDGVKHRLAKKKKKSQTDTPDAPTPPPPKRGAPFPEGTQRVPGDSSPFEGHFRGEKKGPSKGEPNSIYTQVDKKGNAVQNSIYDHNGDIIGHVDFRPETGAPSGHSHSFDIPGKPETGHMSGLSKKPGENKKAYKKRVADQLDRANTKSGEGAKKKNAGSKENQQPHPRRNKVALHNPPATTNKNWLRLPPGVKPRSPIGKTKD